MLTQIFMLYKYFLLHIMNTIIILIKITRILSYTLLNVSTDFGFLGV